MSACSAVFVLNNRGRVIISRDYRGDVPNSHVEGFVRRVNDAEDEGKACPVMECEGITDVFIKHSDLYFVAVSRGNSNIALSLVFLSKLVEVLTSYFPSITEDEIRTNFVVIYELLDEMMDFGYPQTTDFQILQQYITSEKGKKSQVAQKPPPAVTNAVSWRAEGITHPKNEVYLDVVESVSMVVGMDGKVVNSEIKGQVQMRSLLSGMPEVRLGLNDRILFEATGRSSNRAVSLEDIKFHQCVRLAKFESDRTISFVPPDGPFELMSYRVAADVKPLIWVEAVVEMHSRSRVEYSVKVRANFRKRASANNVVLKIPVPSDADSPKVKTTTGPARYKPEESCVVWTIPYFPDGKEHVLRAKFGLPSTTSDDGGEGHPPITVDFELPYYSCSGLLVRYLKVIEKSGYQPLQWVRYITRSGDCQFRIDSRDHKDDAL